jgi:hypothetical protein
MARPLVTPWSYPGQPWSTLVLMKLNKKKRRMKMKILNFTNQADFLPRYPELKVVLFENNPTLYSKEYNLTTNAKL